jgi:hypothetical protein
VKLDLAIKQVADSEAELAEQLEKLGDRHRTEQDVFHMTAALAEMSRVRLERLQEVAERYSASIAGADGDDADGSGREGLLSAVREKTSELIGGRPQAGLVLLRDLRKLHLLAAVASINWTILGQGTQAAKDAELLSLVSECHAEELRALKWTTTHIKVVSPQVLSS